MYGYFEDFPAFKDLIMQSQDYLQHVVLNDIVSEISGIELQVRKRTFVYISWKINKKSPYKPSDQIVLLPGILHVSNAQYVISSHYVQRGYRKRNEIGHILGKRVSLSYCFFFGHLSYTDL